MTDSSCAPKRPRTAGAHPRYRELVHCLPALAFPGSGGWARSVVGARPGRSASQGPSSLFKRKSGRA
eukprot:2073006-Alexandrium_andersonii.AAC.1